MKFFRPELWLKINSEIEEERKKAEAEWDKNDKLYFKIFQEVKKRLPEQFLSIYMANKGFHDFSLKKINVYRKDYCLEDSNDVCLDIVISNTYCSWKISYINVKNFTFDYQIEDELAMVAVWGYDEFIDIGCKTLSHEILFSTGNILSVYFEKISISEVQS